MAQLNASYVYSRPDVAFPADEDNLAFKGIDAYSDFKGAVASLEPLIFNTPVHLLKPDVIAAVLARRPEAAGELMELMALAARKIEDAKNAEVHQAQSQRFSDMREFKKQVGRVAMQYAREHGWCSVVREALDELDITPPEQKYTGTITITLPFRGTWTGDGEPEGYNVNLNMDDTYDYRNGLPVFGLYLDDDEWKDVTFDYDSADVSSLESQEG